MLGGLSDKLKATFDKISRLGVVDKEAIEELVSDIQRSLLSADVDVNLVFQLSDSFKHYEVAKNVYLANSGAVLAANSKMFNTDVWKSLDKDIQDILWKLRLDFNAHYAKALMDFESGVIENWKTKYNVKFNEPTPEDLAIAEKAGHEAQEWFIKKQESDGYPARKVWDYYRKAYKKYEDEVKAKGYPWQR